MEDWQWGLLMVAVGCAAALGWFLFWMEWVINGTKEDMLDIYRAWFKTVSGAARATTTQASKGGLLAAEVAAFAKAYNDQVDTSLGNQESSSPPRTPGSSQSPTAAQWEELSHVARCSKCQGQPGRLRSLSRMLARAADGLEASTSASEDTSLFAAPKPAPATFGLSASGDLPPGVSRAWHDAAVKGFDGSDPL